MLKKKYRLNSKALIKFENTLSEPCFILKTSKNNLPFNRFRIVVSKKIDKRAVVRNKIRRMMSLCIEEIFDNIKTGWDFVFYTKKEILTLSKEKLFANLKEVFLKRNLLK